jgi:hypothetical protein
MAQNEIMELAYKRSGKGTLNETGSRIFASSGSRF